MRCPLHVQRIRKKQNPQIDPENLREGKQSDRQMTRVEILRVVKVEGIGKIKNSQPQPGIENDKTGHKPKCHPCCSFGKNFTQSVILSVAKNLKILRLCLRMTKRF